MISHLFYADDALFISDRSKMNIRNLTQILRCFYASSGLKFNLHNSKVFGIRASLQETTRWVHILGCEPYSIPFNYLCVPVGANMNLKKIWKPIIERIQAKLTVWKAKKPIF